MARYSRRYINFVRYSDYWHDLFVLDIGLLLLLLAYQIAISSSWLNFLHNLLKERRKNLANRIMNSKMRKQ